MSKEQEVFNLLKENNSLNERIKENKQKVKQLLNIDFEAEKEKVLNIFDLESQEVSLINKNKNEVMPKGD